MISCSLVVAYLIRILINKLFGLGLTNTSKREQKVDQASLGVSRNFWEEAIQGGDEIRWLSNEYYLQAFPRMGKEAFLVTPGGGDDKVRRISGVGVLAALLGKTVGS